MLKGLFLECIKSSHITNYDSFVYNYGEGRTDIHYIEFGVAAENLTLIFGLSIPLQTQQLL